MNPDLWKRAETLFHAALSMSPEEREELIAGAMTDDPELGKRVETLIDSHETSEDFLQPPGEVDPALAEDVLSAVITGWRGSVQTENRGSVFVH